MNQYEAMVIIRPDASEEAKKTIIKQIEEQITKSQGVIDASKVWADKFKMAFRIKKFEEGFYHVINFHMPASEVIKLKQLWKLNDDILRFLLLRLDK